MHPIRAYISTGARIRHDNLQHYKYQSFMLKLETLFILFCGIMITHLWSYYHFVIHSFNLL